MAVDPVPLLLDALFFLLMPVLLCLLSVCMLHGKAKISGWSMVGVNIFVGLAFPCFLTVMWSKLANTFKNDTSSDIDPKSAGIWIAISLIASVITTTLAVRFGFCGDGGGKH